jgi:hypothetical protein
MPDFLELKEAGAFVTMKLQSVARAKSKFGEDYVFLGNIEHNRQAKVSVPEKATERQLANVLKVDHVDDLVGRWIVISRSDAPGPNGKLYWNITWADDEAYGAAQPPSSVAPAASRRVQGPGEDYGEELKRDPHGTGATGQPLTPKAEAKGSARPSAAAPVTADERDTAEAERRAEMVRLRKIFHGLWESEALVQLQVAASLAAAHPELPLLVVDGSSVNAATASQFIEFNRKNLL